MPRIATKQINFMVTDEELAVLEMNAGRAGLKIPTFCKNAALAVKVRPQVISKELGQAMLPHISHMGSNLNQIAKKANTEGITLEMAAQLEDIQNQLNALWDLVLYGKKPKTHKSEEEKLEEVTGQTVLQERKPETCPVCGGVAVCKHSDKQNKDYWICPNYSKEEKGHLFKWVE